MSLIWQRTVPQTMKSWSWSQGQKLLHRPDGPLAVLTDTALAWNFLVTVALTFRISRLLPKIRPNKRGSARESGEVANWRGFELSTAPAMLDAGPLGL
jgi:hypothetical protein